MDKTNFKVVYNLVKDYDLNQFDNLINNIQNNQELKKVVEENGVSETVKMIKKINNFFNSDLETSEEYVENKNVTETSILNKNDNLNTEQLSEASLSQIGGTETTLDTPINNVDSIQSILDDI